MLVYLNQLSASDFSCLEMLKLEGKIVPTTKNSIIFQQQDMGTVAYTSISGIAKVVLLSCSGQMRTVSYLTPGIFFGQSAAFMGFTVPSSLAVMSVTDIEILAVPKEIILKYMQKSSDFAAYMLKCAALQICNLLNHIEATTFGDSDFQVASVLNSFPKQQKKGEECVVITQEELASIIGKTRVTVANTIRRLQDLKIIRLIGKKTIIIEKKEELAYMAGDLKVST
jgi:CRP-like cAMP-binding protein